MKTLMLILLAIPAFAQYEFEESINYDLFTKINKERVKRKLPELTYYMVMQNTLDQVAENIKTKMCHCYGDTYKYETLYVAESTDFVIDDLQKRENRKENPILMKDIHMITIGASEDPEHLYFVIRTY